MSEWDVVTRRCAASVVLSAALSSGPLAAQTAAESAAEQSWAQPRTPWGDPDLQGVCRYEAAMPFERPALRGARVAQRRGSGRDRAQARTSWQQSCSRAPKARPWDVRRSKTRRSAATSTTASGRIRVGRGRPIGRRRSSSIRADGCFPYTRRCAKKADGALRGRLRCRAVRVLSRPRHRRALFDRRRHRDDVSAARTAGPIASCKAPASSRFCTRSFATGASSRWTAASTAAPPVVRRRRGASWEGDTLVVETTQFIDRTNYEWATIFGCESPRRCDSWSASRASAPTRWNTRSPSRIRRLSRSRGRAVIPITRLPAGDADLRVRLP